MRHEREIAPLPHIVITRHARDRWHEYHGHRSLTASWVGIRLNSTLRRGARYRFDAVEVHLESALYGVCVPDATGGWHLVTIADKRPSSRRAQSVGCERGVS